MASSAPPFVRAMCTWDGLRHPLRQGKENQSSPTSCRKVRHPELQACPEGLDQPESSHNITWQQQEQHTQEVQVQVHVQVQSLLSLYQEQHTQEVKNAEIAEEEPVGAGSDDAKPVDAEEQKPGDELPVPSKRKNEVLSPDCFICLEALAGNKALLPCCKQPICLTCYQKCDSDKHQCPHCRRRLRTLSLHVPY